MNFCRLKWTSSRIAETDALLSRMILENPGCLLLAAEHEGNIVGTCSVQTLISTAEGGLSAMIEDIVVSREFRKCGIGRRFLEEAERWARGRGITRMQLLCDETNLPARKFYEKTGWDRTHLMNYFRFCNLWLQAVKSELE